MKKKSTKPVDFMKKITQFETEISELKVQLEEIKELATTKQRQQDRMDDIIKEIDRVLLPSGHLFLWVDKFHLCQGITTWLNDTSFQIVDMIVWDKAKMGMGYRSRRRSEYLVVLQKLPIKAKAVWTDHAIPDVWVEKTIKTHPHSKPIELQKRLIEATSNEQDFILDPASGGYSIFEVCKITNRNFIGGDIVFGD